MSKEFYSVSTLVSTIVGVGIFSLPYITAKVGLPTMLVYFLVLTVLTLLIYLIFAEVSLKTPDYKRLPGIAEYHLGPWAKKVALASMVLSSIGSILAYIIIGGDFLAEIFSPMTGSLGISSGQLSVLFAIIYWLLGSALIFLGINIISKIETLGFILFFVLLAALFLIGIPHFKIENLMVRTGGWADIFLPYGAIIFALWGGDMIPEVEEMLGEKKYRLKKIIIASVVAVVAIDLFFIALTLGVSGAGVNSSAIASLAQILGPLAGAIGFIFGIVASFTSFITSGLTLKKILNYDLKVSKLLSALVTCLVPIFIFLLGVRNFIPIISLIGGVMLGVNGFLILAMYKKIKPEQNNLLLLPLMAVLLAGMAYEIIYFFN
ncbi:MAG: aromatic amino acid transport family protein [Candidatus Paceibacterota bacterium]|jgi:amino acid permease